MVDKIRVALVGLNEAGEIFAEHFLEQIQEGQKPVEIIAVSDPNPNSPVALGFAEQSTGLHRPNRYRAAWRDARHHLRLDR